MFRVGDIVHMRFAGTRMEFYILDVSDGFIRYCSLKWCDDSAEWESIEEFGERGPILIAHGIRTIMSFIPIVGGLWPRYKR